MFKFIPPLYWVYFQLGAALAGSRGNHGDVWHHGRFSASHPLHISTCNVHVINYWTLTFSVQLGNLLFTCVFFCQEGREHRKDYLNKCNTIDVIEKLWETFWISIHFSKQKLFINNQLYLLTLQVLHRIQPWTAVLRAGRGSCWSWLGGWGTVRLDPGRTHCQGNCSVAPPGFRRIMKI